MLSSLSFLFFFFIFSLLFISFYSYFLFLFYIFSSSFFPFSSLRLILIFYFDGRVVRPPLSFYSKLFFGLWYLVGIFVHPCFKEIPPRFEFEFWVLVKLIYHVSLFLLPQLFFFLTTFQISACLLRFHTVLVICVPCLFCVVLCVLHKCHRPYFKFGGVVLFSVTFPKPGGFFLHGGGKCHRVEKYI